MDPEAVNRYGGTVSEELGQLQQVQSAVSGITVTADAFGHLPNAQNLASTYMEHAAASRQNVQVLAQALSGVVSGLRATAQNYAAQDRSIGGGFGGGQ
ncbi:type VII secretion target [Kitasatospora sp. NBC_00315]|uniref:type VII secretion target n=1 Tax=Kitasatospora sp. NBC_00315 TaxID=2975963 RepID=UPI00324EA6B1